MKRFISVLLAVLFTASMLCIPASAEMPKVSLDDIFQSQIGSLDYFHSLSPSYMAFRVSRDLYDLYLPDDLDEEVWEYPISAEIYESYLFSLFEVSDSVLRSVRLCAYYNEADNTYMLEYIGGFGGSLQPREYQGFKNNGDGTYSVFYATINYLYLPDSEYDKAEELDWPFEYEYEGKIYESGPDGYVCTDGILKSGRKYTVSYNEKTGDVRFIAQDNYTESDLPESFDSEEVPAVIYFEMRHDLGVEIYFDKPELIAGATVTIAKETKSQLYKAIAEKMADVSENFTVYNISARNSEWVSIGLHSTAVLTFDIPEGFESPAVLTYDLQAKKLIDVYYETDAENGRISVVTEQFAPFVIYDKKIPAYTLGDVNSDGAVDKYDYILVKRAVMGTFNLDEAQSLAADVNGDGAVDKFDYILIKRAVMGTFVIG